MKKLTSLFLILYMLLLVPSVIASTPPPRCELARLSCQAAADREWTQCRADGGYYAICWLVYNDTYYYCTSNYGC